MEARKKRRSITDIYEEKSIGILRNKLPEEWVIHDYRPDYGIDKVIEIFDFIDEDKKMTETLGELIFVQLKSAKNLNYRKKKVYPRQNVAKGSLTYHKNKCYEIDVVNFQLEVSELLTIQSMGAAIPVLLILIDISTEKAFFICLNDYIDKIIIPEDPLFYQKQSKVINIPISNEFSSEASEILPLKLYAKRSKMYGAFCKFNYQHHELQYMYNTFSGYPASFESSIEYNSEESIIDTLRTFTQTALNQDIWKTPIIWQAIRWSHRELQEMESKLEKFEITCGPCILSEVVRHAYLTWEHLAQLSNIYEEIVREQYMPTAFMLDD